MKFLIIQTAFIGDVILATALVEKLHQFYPDASIDFLLRKGNETLLEGHPHIRQVWIWNKKKHKYRNLFFLTRDIRKARYDWVINCQRFAASGLLALFSGARHTVGFSKNPFAVFFSHRISHDISATGQPVHEVERNLALIKNLTDDSVSMPRLYPSKSDFEYVLALTQGLPYVCIAPTSVWFTKQWPLHKWVELILLLPASCTVFLLGAPNDAEACEYIAQISERPNIQNLAGRLSLLQSAALMRGALLNYVNDSAPLHIASAMNAPVAAVFCSTVPQFGFGPLSDQQWIYETEVPLKCRPCGLHGYSNCPEGHFACAETIEVEWLLNQGTVGF